MGRKGQSRNASPAPSTHSAASGASDDSILSAVADVSKAELESRSVLLSPEGHYRGDGISRGTPCGADDREVLVPHQYRVDTGTVAMYCGNWGGHKNSAVLRRHIEFDLLDGPMQIFVAQECQKALVPTLEAGKEGILSAVAEEEDPDEATPAGRTKCTQWLCVAGEEKGLNTLVTGGLRSMFARVDLLLWEKHAGGQYTENAKGRKHSRIAYSRILIVKMWFNEPMQGREYVTVANLHLNAKVAKKYQKLGKAHDEFWDRLCGYVDHYSVDYLAGDWNMAVFLVGEEFEKRGLRTWLLANYVWREGAETKTTVSAVADPFVRFDSMAIYACREPASIKLCFPSACLEDVGNLQHFASGQGYKISSYMGGDKSLARTLRMAENAHGDGLPAKHKLMKTENGTWTTS